jgi:pimeloyl-ACP methyl ester carboxylesterase
VRGVILVAAGGLIGPSTPLGSAFRDAPPTKLTGPEGVALGARWLSPASDPSVLTSVECWPQVHIAHLATSHGVPRDEWWTGGNAPLLVIQGLDDIVAPPANGHALRDQLGERAQVVDIPRAGHFVIVEQPDPVVAAVTDFVGGRRVNPHSARTARDKRINLKDNVDGHPSSAADPVYRSPQELDRNIASHP